MKIDFFSAFTLKTSRPWPLWLKSRKYFFWKLEEIGWGFYIWQKTLNKKHMNRMFTIKLCGHSLFNKNKNTKITLIKYFYQYNLVHVTRIYEILALFTDFNFVLHAFSRISFLKFEKFQFCFEVFLISFWAFLPFTRRNLLQKYWVFWFFNFQI